MEPDAGGGMTSHCCTYLRTRFCALILALLLAISPCGSVFANDSPSADVVAEFEVAPEADMILVPVTINDKKYPFCINTGAPTSEFDEILRPMLGSHIVGAGHLSSASDRSEIHFRTPRASLGPIQLEFPDGVCCRDYTTIGD